MTLLRSRSSFGSIAAMLLTPLGLGAGLGLVGGGLGLGLGDPHLELDRDHDAGERAARRLHDQAVVQAIEPGQRADRRLAVGRRLLLAVADEERRAREAGDERPDELGLDLVADGEVLL